MFELDKSILRQALDLSPVPTVIIDMNRPAEVVVYVNQAFEALSGFDVAELVGQPWWAEAFTAYARCARITRGLEERLSLNPAAYREPVEQPLHDAYLAAVTRAPETEPASALGEQLRALQGPINAYFENVLVNAEDESLRRARLALVQHIAALPSSVADLSKLQGF